MSSGATPRLERRPSPRRASRVALGFALLVLVTAPAAAQGTERWMIGDSGQHCTVSLETRLRQGRVFKALRLESVASQGRVIALDESPLWRLDLRDLSALGPGASTTPFMMLLPSVNPGENPFGDTVLWVDTSLGADVRVVRQDGGLLLEWRDLSLAHYIGMARGTATIRVRLSYPGPDSSLRAEIAVDLGRDPSGVCDHALLSVGFPELILDELAFGAEAAGATHRDDLLLSCFQHGTLWYDPIQLGLKDHGTGGWGPDSRHFDFAHPASMQFTFPGETSAQFLYYYDLEEQAAADEPWVHRNGPWIDGYGTRPSVRGGGTGLYVAVEDPDANAKRFVTTRTAARDGTARLRLAVRTWLEFRGDRLETLSAGGSPGGLHQSYRQGRWGDDAARPRTDDLHFEFPAVLRVLRGDWVDASERYRDWLEAESRALQRDTAGNPIAVRDSTWVPQAYRELMAVIGLSEAVDPASGPSYPLLAAQLARSRAYLDFLRASAPEFQRPEQDLPWYAVIHGEGMAAAASGRPPFKSSGNDTRNFPARDGLLQLFRGLRLADPSVGWIGRVLTAVNRDTGTLFADVGTSDPRLAWRESGEPAVRGWAANGAPDRYLSSYAREESVSYLLSLLDRSRFALQLDGEVQIDWIWTSGQGSAVKPDYSNWDPARRTGRDSNGRAGGGSRWWRRHADLRDVIMTGAPRLSAPLGAHTMFGTERLSEAFLTRNIPAGHRQTFPATALDQGGIPSLHPLLYAESVPVTSILFHEYALMRGDLESFSHYFARPYTVGTSHTVLDEALFDQTDADERWKGTVLAMRRIAQQILADGVIPGVAIDVSGDADFEREAGMPGVLDHPADRISTGFSGLVTAGEDDKARGGWTSGDPAWTLRELLRVRSRLREFLNGGRRLRDPMLIRPTREKDWYHDRLALRRWAQTDLQAGGWTIREFHGGENRAGAPPRGMKLEKLIVGAWVDDAVPVGERGSMRAVVAVFNACAETPVSYQLEFTPSDWDLPAGEIYTLRAVDAALESGFGPNGGVGTLASGRTTPLQLPEGVSGQAPMLEPWGIQLWILEIL